MKAWAVSVGYKWIDTVHFDASMSEEEVRDALIRQERFSPEIRLTEEKY